MRPILLAALCAAALPAEAASFSTPSGCSGPEYRALDFWLGTWDVAGAAGKFDGHNVISATLSGCAVRELWSDAEGYNGESLFFFDRSLGRWKQVWATSR